MRTELLSHPGKTDYEDENWM